VLDKARQMEEEGHRIIKLNIGNIAAFGLHAARRDRAGHDPQPARRGGLHRQQGPVRAAQGGGALHPGKAHRPA
jgi:hypothetical protein